MRAGAAAYRRTAARQLQRFRQGSTAAVALTALLLLIGGAPVDVEEQAASAAQPAADVSTAVGEAAVTIRDLAYGFYGVLPRLAIVLALIVLAMIVGRTIRIIVTRSLRGTPYVDAAAAMVRVGVSLIAAIAAISVVAGDVRAVVGSVGLVGLAASWALQTPIESFTGWLLNSFHSYYRVGDRVAVGEVFGDVVRIDILTTTIWEAGGAGKTVAAAQPTGALITVPNWEVLRSNIVNYSRDFPFVWDEITVGVANESDLRHAETVLTETTRRVLGDEMAEAAERYRVLLRSSDVALDVEEVPRVYFSGNDSWTDCTVRYLVPVRSRRGWSSRLLLEISETLARPEHAARVLPVYPRREIVTREAWPAVSAPRPSPE